MIGPASRRHFVQALQAAGQAEMLLPPPIGSREQRLANALARAQIELLRGIAFSFLQPDEEEEHEPPKPHTAP